MHSPDKPSLRKIFKARRDELPPSEHAKFSHACGEKAVALVDSLALPGSVIAGYAPMKSELEILPALKSLAVKHSVTLPVITESLRLSFRRYHPGDTLTKGRHGIFEPPAEAETLVPDILLVPLLAFDRSGHRLGYGAGYYDATLSHLRGFKPIIAIGVGFALQEIEALPAEAFDQTLDAVITERETIRFRK